MAVNIRDECLADAIRKELGIYSDQTKVSITEDQMQSLTCLKAPNKGIIDLTGLEHARNLKTLDLGCGQVGSTVNRNSIRCIFPLKDLSKLNNLSLERNALEDLSPLAGLKGIEWLNLWGNLIEYIEPLADLTQLKGLWLQGNRISDISPLKNLTCLTELMLHDNRISNLSSLSNLTKLKKLELDTNSLSGLSCLGTLNNWNWLINVKGEHY